MMMMMISWWRQQRAQGKKRRTRRTRMMRMRKKVSTIFMIHMIHDSLWSSQNESLTTSNQHQTKDVFSRNNPMQLHLSIARVGDQSCRWRLRRQICLNPVGMAKGFAKGIDKYPPFGGISDPLTNTTLVTMNLKDCANYSGPLCIEIRDIILAKRLWSSNMKGNKKRWISDPENNCSDFVSDPTSKLRSFWLPQPNYSVKQMMVF